VVDDGSLIPALDRRLNAIPSKVYTDASTMAEAEEYESALDGRECTHLGLVLGEAEAALPLACAAKALGAEEPALILSGGLSEALAVVVAPGEAA
jgi:hypothetical protein